MEPYKILRERPTAQSFAVEKRMDFDALLSHAIRVRRVRLIRNTAVTTLFASTALFSSLYVLQNDHNTKRPVPAITADSVQLPGKRNENMEEKINTRSPSPETPGKNVAPPTSARHGERSGDSDSFKIQEGSLPLPTVVPARPYGGLDSLQAYLRRHLVYPSKVAEQKVEGTVVVSFVIGSDGKVDDVRIVKALHPTLDSIAVGAVKLMPPWDPARSNGTAVQSRHTIPLDFHVEK